MYTSEKTSSVVRASPFLVRKKSKNRIKKKCLHFHPTRPQEHNATKPRIERNAFFFNILFFLIKKEKRFPGVLTETLGRLTTNFPWKRMARNSMKKTVGHSWSVLEGERGPSKRNCGHFNLLTTTQYLWQFSNLCNQLRELHTLLLL